MKRYVIDYGDIITPPYGGPPGKPLPDVDLTEDEIAGVVEDLVLGKKPKKTDSPFNTLKARVSMRHDMLTRVWERQFVNVARDRFEADKRKLLSLLRAQQKAAKEAKATIDWQAIYAGWMTYLDGAGNEWRKAFIPVIKGLILDHGEALNLEFGMTFEVANLFAQEWFDTYTFRFAEDVIATTGAALQSMLKTAQAEGWSIPVMQKRLELMFTQWMEGGLTAEEFDWFEERMPKYRTEMIARSETIRASNKGADALYGAWGVEWKEWVSGLDVEPEGRTCVPCFALNGKRFPVGAVVSCDGVEFTKGAIWNFQDEEGKTHTIKFDYETVTGPPLHPQCRCSWVPWMERWGESQ